ncbi:hypothetical protein HanRHA438_Chr14g0676311 [Helianthus annuus]|nr:hypothetical protein HanRHA438_Chr14g0676311 [Helianthus annuus]
MKAKAIEIWNVLHDNAACDLQMFVSFMNTTMTPADEQAAASDRIAVTCLHIIITNVTILKEIFLQYLKTKLLKNKL